MHLTCTTPTKHRCRPYEPTPPWQQHSFTAMDLKAEQCDLSHSKHCSGLTWGRDKELKASKYPRLNFDRAPVSILRVACVSMEQLMSNPYSSNFSSWWWLMQSPSLSLNTLLNTLFFFIILLIILLVQRLPFTLIPAVTHWFHPAGGQGIPPQQLPPVIHVDKTEERTKMWVTQPRLRLLPESDRVASVAALYVFPI